MLAILQQALDEAAGIVTSNKSWLPSRRREVRLVTRNAQRWIASDRDGWPCSFVRICGVLGLNPDAVRRKVRRVPHLRRRQSA